MRLVNGLVIVGLISLSSCATVRGWRGGDDGASAAPQAEAALDVAASEAESRAQLVALVDAYIDAANADSRDNEDRIIRKRPYFYKEYNSYPGRATDAEIELTETDSRTSPFIADVQLERIRYATRYHRSRDDARLDSSFLRDTGTETLTYELRNGRWTRVGSFFLAEATEEQVNGNWVPVQRVLQREVQTEEPEQGWFGRTWSRISGTN